MSEGVLRIGAHEYREVRPGVFAIPLSELGDFRLADLPPHSSMEITGLPEVADGYRFSIAVTNGGDQNGDQHFTIQYHIAFQSGPDAYAKLNQVRCAFAPLVAAGVLPDPLTTTQFNWETEEGGASYIPNYARRGHAVIRDELGPVVAAMCTLARPQEDSRDFVVANFHSLEAQLIECMEFVPFLDQNHSVFSPKFVPILLDACSLIESVLRHATDGAKRHSLRSYASIHEERLDLDNTTTILLVSPLRFLRPFRGWRSTAPNWWEAHNRVKHDRIRHYHSASYVHTIAALAGLHQVLARSWQFLGHLTRAGWFNETSESFVELGAARAAGAGPPDLPVQTKLFVSAIRGDFVDWSTDPPTIERWDFAERVKSHIWEWEGW